ncbi:Hypothetical protein R9X50_00102000 [Acrodontium crateriforme]|uniref:mRNA N(6)-methyladenine demethylase n=1 Tax=Acrodontium crateriforme TaxID=150365 RepID=A0AAQ3LZ00_9PEZI|nr:Hypothetical protein R9X50_00102000 [Acrodontium crateriforme]
MAKPDAHAKPPEAIRNVYKRYQKMDSKALVDRNDLYDSKNLPKMVTNNSQPTMSNVNRSFANFLGAVDHEITIPTDETADISSEPYEIPNLPGLFVYPSLLTPAVQLAMLNRLLHRDLSNQNHQTNLHLHYNITYPHSACENVSLNESFFSSRASNITLQPKDPSIHKQLNMNQVLNKKLRWTTLGGQYDWTNKVYPSSRPPPFPKDVKRLIEDLFPMKAEAAIVNFYSPGDTLSLHRDVSEECSQPLVSISLGCDGLFVVGLDADGENNEASVATIRLRSGDALLMSGPSRYAWHSVPKILENTCPSWMQDWPAMLNPSNDDDSDDGPYAAWKGWMKGKRINLNVRQMFA